MWHWCSHVPVFPAPHHPAHDGGVFAVAHHRLARQPLREPPRYLHQTLKCLVSICSSSAQDSWQQTQHVWYPGKGSILKKSIIPTLHLNSSVCMHLKRLFRIISWISFDRLLALGFLSQIEFSSGDLKWMMVCFEIDLKYILKGK